MGAWIETYLCITIQSLRKVAPLVGAWIETYYSENIPLGSIEVAPLVGAWIETRKQHLLKCPISGRSPRGSVD